jgi:hypothetical protein
VTLTILNVAYPFAPVGPDAVGGAEQVLGQLDAALVQAGHRSLVVACESSQVAGTLIAVPRITGLIDPPAIEAARARHRRAIAAALNRWKTDLVHLHGVDFHAYLPPAGVPALATLHLPPDWYAAQALEQQRQDTWLLCVSWSQRATYSNNPRLLPPIENGVAADLFFGRHAKR